MVYIVYLLLIFALFEERVYSQSNKNVNLECGVATTWFPLVVSQEKVNDAEYPWMAALYVYKDQINNYDFLCTTTLISKRHVISAGHCVQYETIFLYDEADMVLVFGKTDLTNWARDSVRRQVARADVHPNYTQGHTGHDLVIFSFNEPVELSATIYPICLWNAEWGRRDVLGGGIVAGWGKTKRGDETFSVVPYKVTMPMVGLEVCKASHQGFADMVSEYSLCAGERNGAGPCGGDTGAGFAAKVGGRHYLRGVVSYVVPKFGTLCDLEQYVLFSDLVNETTWIESVIATNIPVETPKPAVNKVELKYRLNFHPDICGTNNGTQNNLEPLEEGDYPWAVTISIYDGKFPYKCMGTLLTEKHVITAAQCIKNLAGDITPNYRFLLNFLRFSGEGIETGGVLRMAVHKEYKRPPVSDVAVMIMFSPVRFTANIKPICLWDDSDDEKEVVDKKGLVIGYTSHKNVDVYSTKPEVITMPYVSKEKCLKSDPRFTTLATDERIFCAGYANASIPVPCTGHAGAGFLMKHKGRWTLRGLVSAALPNDDYTGCDREKYAIFVDLAKYKKWISEQLKID